MPMLLVVNSKDEFHAYTCPILTRIRKRILTRSSIHRYWIEREWACVQTHEDRYINVTRRWPLTFSFEPPKWGLELRRNIEC